MVVNRASDRRVLFMILQGIADGQYIGDNYGN